MIMTHIFALAVGILLGMILAALVSANDQWER